MNQRHSPARSGSHSAAARSGSGQVRIIGGQWRRTRLPVASSPGLRPTPDRVRETLFNWLGQELHGLHCLDAFAGSGALGFEAASRHAAQVLLIERDGRLAAQLQANARRLQAGNIEIRHGDGLAALEQAAGQGQRWDVVFIDPPYAAGLQAQALACTARVLTAQGLVYLESSQEWPAPELEQAHWQRLRYLRAGQVHAHLLRPAA